MRIVLPAAQILEITNKPLELIEHAGRTAYKSEHKIGPGTAQAFVKMLLTRNPPHESVLEHASATIKFVCDRGVSHELVRHRIASYTQESTRYCNYSRDQFDGELTFVLPAAFSDRKGRGYDLWQSAMLSDEQTYLEMLRENFTPQVARSILPNSLKTEIVVTANFREWRHIFKLRLAPNAHPDMRATMALGWLVLSTAVPIVFDEYKDLANSI